MATRPAHLTAENAAAFRERSVVEAYHLRPPYPPELFAILLNLAGGEPSAVLDAGAGTGELARPLAGRGCRVDAVDLSAPMVARGRTLPGGDDPRLRWIVAPVETAELRPPYDLVTAGDSVHWMAWEVAFPRFRELLTPAGLVALVTRGEPDLPWGEGLGALIRRYSTMRDYEPFDQVGELERRGLFRAFGRRETAPVTFRQTIDDYVASYHSRASLVRERMPPGDLAAFDRALRELVGPYATGGRLALPTVAEVVWGVPGVRAGEPV